MNILTKNMFVLRHKGTNEYIRNNGDCRDLNDTKCKSAIKLYETENNAKTAIRRCQSHYKIVPIIVDIKIME